MYVFAMLLSCQYTPTTALPLYSKSRQMGHSLGCPASLVSVWHLRDIQVFLDKGCMELVDA